MPSTQSTNTQPLVFSHIKRNGCQPEKLLHTVANPARCLLNRGKNKEKGWRRTPPPPLPPLLIRRKKKKKHVTHPHACVGATEVSVRLVSVQGLLRLIGQGKGCRSSTYYASQSRCRVYLFFPPCATINLHPPSMTVSTHTSASNNVVAFQPPTMKTPRMALCTQSAHFFSFPPRLLHTALLRFPKTTRFGNHPPFIRMSIPTYKKNVSCATLLQSSRTGLSQGHGRVPTL